tara:strand:- start:1249 stop:1365 length:117 start_codon:yes stop_codon:yes gene_type:complete
VERKKIATVVLATLVGELSLTEIQLKSTSAFSVIDEDQ